MFSSVCNLEYLTCYIHVNGNIGRDRRGEKRKREGRKEGRNEIKMKEWKTLYSYILALLKVPILNISNFGFLEKF